MSFQLKIFAALLAAQLALLAVFSWIGLSAVEGRSREIAKEQGVANALLLARTLAEPVSFFDLARIDEFLGALASDPLVLSASVVSVEGGVLSESGERPNEMGPTIRDVSVSARLERDETIYHEYAGIQKFLAPIKSNGSLVGALDLQISNPAMASAIAKVKKIGAIALLCGVVAALAVSYVLSRQLSSRLSDLRRVSEALGSGDLSARAALGGRDELTVLARSFNGMAERIEVAQAVLESKVRTDYLTGIPNRVAVEERLDRLLGSANAGHARLLHIDLDRFKEVNDSLGHRVGDRVLQQVSIRLRQILTSQFGSKESAVPGFIGRIGGDEFTGIMPEIGDEATLVFAQRLIIGVSRPIIVNSEVVRVGASIGIARIHPEACKGLEDILGQADIALYEAKRIGGGKAVLIDDPLKERVRAKSTLIKDVERGLEAGEFHPFLQPQIDLKTGDLVGFELLSRWEHPKRGIVTPSGFIALLHDTPLVAQIDKATRQAALRWFSRARKATPGLEKCRIGLNITETQLSYDSFVTELLWQIDAFDLEPENIAIEVLENVLVEDNSERTHANLHELARKGFAIELDDFGTGHSAMSNLMSFSVNRIKIDRSFISGMEKDDKKQILVSALVSAGRAFGVSILAEGVETPEELKAAFSLGCDEAQGYVIGRPMNLNSLENWLDARKHLAA